MACFQPNKICAEAWQPFRLEATKSQSDFTVRCNKVPISPTLQIITALLFHNPKSLNMPILELISIGTNVYKGVKFGVETGFKVGQRLDVKADHRQVANWVTKYDYGQ